jgi:hypothetical protein
MTYPLYTFYTVPPQIENYEAAEGSVKAFPSRIPGL